MKNIKFNDLCLNKGKIEGLSENPRFIRDDKFKYLVKSIQDAQGLEVKFKVK